MAEDSTEASVARDWLSAPSAWALEWRPHPTPMDILTAMGTPTVMLLTPTTVAAAILSQGGLGPRGAGVFVKSRCVTEVSPPRRIAQMTRNGRPQVPVCLAQKTNL